MQAVQGKTQGDAPMDAASRAGRWLRQQVLLQHAGSAAAQAAFAEHLLQRWRAQGLLGPGAAGAAASPAPGDAAAAAASAGRGPALAPSSAALASGWRNWLAPGRAPWLLPVFGLAGMGVAVWLLLPPGVVQQPGGVGVQPGAADDPAIERGGGSGHTLQVADPSAFAAQLQATLERYQVPVRRLEEAGVIQLQARLPAGSLAPQSKLSAELQALGVQWVPLADGAGRLDVRLRAAPRLEPRP